MRQATLIRATGIAAACALIGVTAVLAQVHVAPIKDKPENILPLDNKDLDPIIAAANRAAARAGQCRQCNEKGGKTDCTLAEHEAKDAIDLAAALDVQRNALRKYSDMLLAQLKQQQADYDRNAARDAELREAYNLSKTLSDSAKLAMDLISLRDLGGALQKMIANPAGIAAGDSKFDQILAQLKDMDNLASAVAAPHSLPDDFAGARLGGGGDPGAPKPVKNKAVKSIDALKANVLNLKDVVSGTLDSVKAWRDAAKALAESNRMAPGGPLGSAARIARDAKLAKESAALSAAGASVGQFLVKLGGMYAESLQEKMLDEIRELATVLPAGAQSYASTVADLQRLARREAALDAARALARKAAEASWGCRATCLPSTQIPDWWRRAHGSESVPPWLAANLKLSEYPEDKTVWPDQTPNALQRGGAGMAKAALQALAGYGDDQKLCKEPPPQPVRPATATPTTPNTSPACTNPGGATGAVNDVACQEAGGHHVDDPSAR